MFAKHARDHLYVCTAIVCLFLFSISISFLFYDSLLLFLFSFVCFLFSLFSLFSISSSDKSYDVIADVEIMMESYSADTSLPHDKDIEEIFFLPDVIQIKYRREPSALSSPTVELEKPVMQDKTLVRLSFSLFWFI